jgi:hypothetical protein
MPSDRAVCAPGLTCVFPEPTNDVPGTCTATCSSDSDCDDGFCGWAEDNNTRICKPYSQEGESCEGFVMPSHRSVCAPGLTCVFPEPTHDHPGTCMQEIHSGECGDGTFPACLIVVPECPQGRVREIVNHCYGDCVDPLTCLPPPIF